jgi:hypothetical protein
MTCDIRRSIMAKRQSQGGNKSGKGAADKPAGKVGSEPQAAKNLGGQGDFGVPEGDTTGRAYTSANTRASDPGAAQAHAGDDEGRVAGVGSNASGPGSGSGGDLDTDIIGIGTGAGVSQSGAGDPPGPDDATDPTRDFASGPPTKNFKGAKAGKVEGSTVDRTGGDIETTASGRGAQAISRADPDNNAFAGEISMDEASGQDSH